jgi:hypothetical protein
MTTTRARLLAILKEPDRYPASPSLLMTSSLPDMNARHRLKKLCEEIAKVCSDRANHWAESNEDRTKEWAWRALISAAEADRCAAAILALGEDNEHS